MYATVRRGGGNFLGVVGHVFADIGQLDRHGFRRLRRPGGRCRLVLGSALYRRSACSPGRWRRAGRTGDSSECGSRDHCRARQFVERCEPGGAGTHPTQSRGAAHTDCATGPATTHHCQSGSGAPAHPPHVRPPTGFALSAEGTRRRGQCGLLCGRTAQPSRFPRGSPRLPLEHATIRTASLRFGRTRRQSSSTMRRVLPDRWRLPQKRRKRCRFAV